MSRSTLGGRCQPVRPPQHDNQAATYPSRTALPKGRVLLEPPRNRFQMVSPNLEASDAELKVARPVAPPRESVTILPFDWQVLMSLARNAQLGRFVPGKTPESTALQICEDGCQCVFRLRGRARRCQQLTLERSREGSPPAPKKTFTNAMGMALIVSSYSKPDKVMHGQVKLHDV